MNRLLLTIGLVSVFTLLWQLLSQPSPPQFKQTPYSTAQNSAQEKAVFKSDFASHESTPEVHSATAIELDNNNILAFWYGGTREGHKDVKLYSNQWDSNTQSWGEEKVAITREDTRDSTSRYIRKLGNPVVTRGPDKGIWLFYVSVSVGGWAGSAINLSRSYDEGQSWTPSRRLITSPFLNLSTLIKGAPVHYQDGTIGLPVYHEFLGKFGELLRIDIDGEVIDKKRLSWGKTSLQPIVMITSPTEAIAMMRNHGDSPQRILMQSTSDAGLSWSRITKSHLPNPNAGIIGINLQAPIQNPAKESRQPLLLAFNNDEEEREDMSLAISFDQGERWTLVTAVEENRLKIPDKSQQFAYPWLLQTQDGTIHLLYTWHKTHIKHMVFNPLWLQKQMSDDRISLQ